MGLWTSTCDPFDVTIAGDIQAALDRGRAAVAAEGGAFSGDAAAGTFSGSSPVGPIEGGYVVRGQVLTVTITSRPRPAPCGAIEAKVRAFFA